MKTWVDPETNLEWELGRSEEVDWHEAMDYARNKGASWRLPTVEELCTLLDRSKHEPALRTEVPFRESKSYWTSRTMVAESKVAWIIDFLHGCVDGRMKGRSYFARCIKDADYAK